MLILKQCRLFRKIKTESRAEIYLGPVLVAFVLGLIIIISTMLYLKEVFIWWKNMFDYFSAKNTQLFYRQYVHLIKDNLYLIDFGNVITDYYIWIYLRGKAIKSFRTLPLRMS